MNPMTLGTSTVLIAVGAIMRYAISAEGEGFDIRMIGTILMIVGIAGAMVTIGLYASSRGRRSRRTPLSADQDTIIVKEREVR